MKRSKLVREILLLVLGMALLPIQGEARAEGQTADHIGQQSQSSQQQSSQQREVCQQQSFQVMQAGQQQAQASQQQSQATQQQSQATQQQSQATQQQAQTSQQQAQASQQQSQATQQQAQASQQQAQASQQQSQASQQQSQATQQQSQATQQQSQATQQQSQATQQQSQATQQQSQATQQQSQATQQQSQATQQQSQATQQQSQATQQQSQATQQQAQASQQQAQASQQQSQATQQQSQATQQQSQATQQQAQASQQQSSQQRQAGQQQTSLSAVTTQALADGVEAYVYGYPLVLLELTRWVQTNVSAPESSGRAPLNQFSHMVNFPTPEFRDIVRPNLDTLYSMAWLDLGQEAMVLSVPDTSGRYYLMQLLDGWTNTFASIGTRTTGDQAEDIVLVGPGWQGRVPKGLRVVQSPTDIVWVVGRFEVIDPEDQMVVRSLQGQTRLTPLRDWGRPLALQAQAQVDPGVDMTTPPADQVAAMDAAAFFTALAEGLKITRPLAADGPMVKTLAAIGIVPGEDFDMARLDPEVARGLELAVDAAQQKIAEQVPTMGEKVNGWLVQLHSIGTYGTDYLNRATVALAGLGANLPEDAVYPLALADSQNQQLSGASNYVIHFAKDQLPPVNAFWSLTLYDNEGFLVKNPIDRHVIRDRDALRFNGDGSLDLFIQHQAPVGNMSNWLPAPPDPFSLVLRLYWSQADILEGRWQPPAIYRNN